MSELFQRVALILKCLVAPSLVRKPLTSSLEFCEFLTQFDAVVSEYRCTVRLVSLISRKTDWETFLGYESFLRIEHAINARI